jgi:CRP-like cAMP-binding protein
MDPQRLADMPLFATLDDEERAKLAAVMREVRVDAGTALVEEGTSAYELFVIEDGEVEVTKGGRRVRTLGPGDFFGEIGLLATGTRTASVTASTNGRIAAIFNRELAGVEARHPDVVEKLRDAMRARVTHTAF